MSEKKIDSVEQEEPKELSVEDLEDVAGGVDVLAVGVEIAETSGGNRGVRID